MILAGAVLVIFDSNHPSMQLFAETMIMVMEEARQQENQREGERAKNPRKGRETAPSIHYI